MSKKKTKEKIFTLLLRGMLKARHLKTFGNPTPRNSQDVFRLYSIPWNTECKQRAKKSKTLQYSWIKRGRYYNSSCNTMFFLWLKFALYPPSCFKVACHLAIRALLFAELQNASRNHPTPVNVGILALIYIYIYEHCIHIFKSKDSNEARIHIYHTTDYKFNVRPTAKNANS